MLDSPLVKTLLAQLKAADETIRDQATQELWQVWFQQKGEFGFELLRRSHLLFENGNLDQAETLLNEIIESFPDFAEAWNRRAVLYYTQKAYAKAQSDCEQVVSINPVHFGAWHGLGLCRAALGEYQAAIPAFRKALELQPHALVNQKLIFECTARLD